MCATLVMLFFATLVCGGGGGGGGVCVCAQIKLLHPSVQTGVEYWSWSNSEGVLKQGSPWCQWLAVLDRHLRRHVVQAYSNTACLLSSLHCGVVVAVACLLSSLHCGVVVAVAVVVAATHHGSAIDAYEHLALRVPEDACSARQFFERAVVFAYILKHAPVRCGRLATPKQSVRTDFGGIPNMVRAKVQAYEHPVRRAVR